MKLSHHALLAALRGAQSVPEICKSAGVTEQEFAEARSDFLTRRATLTDQRVTATVQNRVDILRDRAGVPHIFGASTHDVYLALGLAMAQARLWQMDRLRRRALGRQAEILGPDYVAAAA